MSICSSLSLFFFFFFKQKTAYEMVGSDWGSDVCSSDLVLLGVDGHLEVMRGRARPRARGDLHGLAGGELRIHAGRRDADALLAAAHAQAVELRAVEQLGEDR